jgi:transposase
MTAMQNSSSERLQGKILEYSNEIVSLKNENAYLKEQLAWFQRQLFGKRSEKTVANLDEEQLLFEGFDRLESTAKEETQTVPAHTRRKPRRDGQDKITLPPDLPVERTVLDLPEKEKFCPETGEPLVKIGEEVTHKLAYKPGSYYLKEIVRPKYALPEGRRIITPELPESFIDKCRVDESFLSHILTQKYADHLPLYRISEILARQGIRISRQLLSQWVLRAGEGLKPLYDEMRKRILESGNVFIDETPVSLQMPKKVKQCYMWVLVGGKGQDPPYRIYDFRENRNHSNALEILKSYKGVVHSDKYGAYETIAKRTDIIWCPCYSHIRRKFVEAESGDLALRYWVLRKLRYLFFFEKIAWKRSEEERLMIRREKEVPIIEELTETIKDKLINGKVLPKSKFREALGYFCGLIPYLQNYIEHPFARLDNNVAERAGRPLAIGRKNWLFVGSVNGGTATAIILSIVQTCRGLNINPYEYLADILPRFMSHSSHKLYELLPDNWQRLRLGLNVSPRALDSFVK